MDMKTIDIGDLCTHCGRDTSFQSGNGLFVNRIPSDTDAKLVLTSGENDIEIQVNASGYMCVDCQCIECDRCGDMTLDYSLETGEVVCGACEAKME